MRARPPSSVAHRRTRIRQGVSLRSWISALGRLRICVPHWAGAASNRGLSSPLTIYPDRCADSPARAWMRGQFRSRAHSHLQRPGRQVSELPAGQVETGQGGVSGLSRRQPQYGCPQPWTYAGPGPSQAILIPARRVFGPAPIAHSTGATKGAQEARRIKEPYLLRPRMCCSLESSAGYLSEARRQQGTLHYSYPESLLAAVFARAPTAAQEA